MDIEQPLLVQDDSVGPLLAYMWMASKTSCKPKPKKSGDTTTMVGRDPEFEAIIDRRALDQAAHDGRPNLTEETHISRGLPAYSLRTGNTSRPSPQATVVTTTQDLPGTDFYVNGKSTRWKVETHSSGSGEFDTVYSYTHYEPAVFQLKSCDVRRWQLARQAMDRYYLIKPDKNLDLVTVKAVPESTDSNVKTEETKASARLAFSLVAASYGGLHALAWNARFPTYRERKLWRISALLIASPPVLYFLLFILAFVANSVGFCCSRLGTKITRKPTEQTRPVTITAGTKLSTQDTDFSLISSKLIIEAVGWVAQALTTAALLVLYFPARGYLVYESFRTVFYLPPEAYQTTSWPQYLPHIT